MREFRSCVLMLSTCALPFLASGCSSIARESPMAPLLFQTPNAQELNAPAMAPHPAASVPVPHVFTYPTYPDNRTGCYPAATQFAYYIMDVTVFYRKLPQTPAESTRHRADIAFFWGDSAYISGYTNFGRLTEAAALAAEIATALNLVPGLNAAGMFYGFKDDPVREDSPLRCKQEFYVPYRYNGLTYAISVSFDASARVWKVAPWTAIAGSNPQRKIPEAGKEYLWAVYPGYMIPRPVEYPEYCTQEKCPGPF